MPTININITGKNIAPITPKSLSPAYRAMTDRMGCISAELPITFGEITCLSPVQAVNTINSPKALKVLSNISSSIIDHGKRTIIGPIIGSRSTNPNIRAIGMKYCWPMKNRKIAIIIVHSKASFSWDFI